jgi:hypothetical protein
VPFFSKSHPSWGTLCVKAFRKKKIEIRHRNIRSNSEAVATNLLMEMYGFVAMLLLDLCLPNRRAGLDDHCSTVRP